MAIALLRNRHDAQGKVQVRTQYLTARWIESCGYQVLRFWKSEVVTNLDGVMATIVDAIQAPSPARRGS